ncbi:MAG: chemotaxis protein CheW [Acidobacteria bacterium]|nr:chemotaxis protein CheW [Acidobacteriota bacterium]
MSAPGSLDNTVDTLRAAFDRAFTLPERPERPPSSAYVCIRVAARRFALRADESLGGRADVPVTRVPSSNPLLLGLANLHGSVMPVCDLRQIVGEPALSSATEVVNGIIIVRQGKTLLALACDEVMGLEWVPDSEIYGETVALRDGAIPLLHAAAVIARAIPEMQEKSQD